MRRDDRVEQARAGARRVNNIMRETLPLEDRRRRLEGQLSRNQASIEDLTTRLPIQHCDGCQQWYADADLRLDLEDGLDAEGKPVSWITSALCATCFDAAPPV